MSRRPWWASDAADPFSTWTEGSGPWAAAPAGIARPQTAARPATPVALADLHLPRPEPLAPVAQAAPATLDLTLRTSDGLPCAGVSLQVTNDDGQREATITTDPQGRARLDLDHDGDYEILLPNGIALPPVPEGPTKAGPVWSRKIVYDEVYFSLSTGRRHDIVVVRPAATEVILDGWAQASCVLRWGGTRVRRDGTVGTARASLARALWASRGKTLLVVGHADPLGADADNAALAAQRASSVALFAKGDLDGWAAHAFAHATDLDWACAMVACARILGMAMPGLTDHKALDAVHQAVRAAGKDGEPIPDDAPPCADDWYAVGEIYETDLAALLMTDRAGLAEIRGAIRSSSPETIAAGERWPRSASEMLDPAIGLAGPPALMHRRVSLVVLGKDDGPGTLPGTDGAALYDGTYARTVVDPPGEVLVEIAIDTPSRDPIAAAHAWIGVGSLGVFRCVAAVDGVVRFPALAGERIQVVAAFDAQGRGTMTTAGLVTKDKQP